MCNSFDGGDLVQVSLSLVKVDCSSVSCKVYQFNIRFDAASRSKHNARVAFFRGLCLDLIAHATRRIPLKEFIHKLKTSRILI